MCDIATPAWLIVVTIRTPGRTDAVPGVAAASSNDGAVYTQSNDAAGNVVRAFDRGPGGALTAAGAVSTGGVGTGAGLGSQGAVALSDRGSLLLAVDAGSDDVAAFRITRHGPRLVDRIGSGGDTPVSVDVDGDRAYVLNAGAAPNVSSFSIGFDGRLHALPGGTVALAAGAAGAAQVSAAPGGSALVVTERLANRLETIRLDRLGRPYGAPAVTPSSGAVPFGFAFRGRDVVVSEATASTVSSYRLSRGGLGLVSGSVATGEGAACWVAISPDGRYAYSGNAGTGTISSFRIQQDGSLALLAGAAATAPSPNDLAFSADGRHLFVINPRVAAITAYRAHRDGSLEPAGSVSGFPAGAAGIAAG